MSAEARVRELEEAAKAAVCEVMREQSEAVAGPPSQWGLMWAITHAVHPVLSERACEQVAQRLEQLRADQSPVDPGLAPGLRVAARLARTLRVPATHEDARAVEVARAVTPTAEAFDVYELDRRPDVDRELLAAVAVDQARRVIDARVLDLLETRLDAERDEERPDPWGRAGRANPELERGLTHAIEAIHDWRTNNTLNDATDDHEPTMTVTLTSAEVGTLITLLTDAWDRREARHEDIQHGDVYEFSDVVGILAMEHRQDALRDRLNKLRWPAKPVAQPNAPSVPQPGDLVPHTPAQPSGPRL